MKNAKGSNQPAMPTTSKRGTPTANPAASDSDANRRNNHKLLKATAAAPMEYDGSARSFDSGGKRPNNSC